MAASNDVFFVFIGAKFTYMHFRSRGITGFHITHFCYSYAMRLLHPMLFYGHKAHIHAFYWSRITEFQSFFWFLHHSDFWLLHQVILFYLFAWTRSVHTCILMIAALPNFTLSCDSYGTRLYPVMFILVLKDAKLAYMRFSHRVIT